MSELLYRATNLTKRYEERTVVDVASLEIERGEILALVGPSGAGKSTLLRLLALLEAPTSGSLQFQGVEVAMGGARPSLAMRRQLTMVFQRPLLLNRNVTANIEYGLRLRGLKAKERVAQVLEQLGLTDLARANARNLSGGEAQRVSLARAMVLETPILLLDEPTANLDPYNVSLIENAIRSINQQRAATVVIVTHNVFQARRLAHRTALLLDGHLVETLPTEAFFNAPDDARTAAFVRGDMVY